MFMKVFDKILALLLGFVAFNGCFGQTTLYTMASGNVNDPLVWSTTGHSGPSCGCTPSSIDSVIIGPHAITLNTIMNAKSIVVNSGGTLDFTGNTANIFDGTFEVNSGATVVSSAGADLEFEAGYCRLTINSGASTTLNFIQVNAIDSLLFTGDGDVTLNDDIRINGDDLTVRFNHGGTLNLATTNASLMLRPASSNVLFINTGTVNIGGDVQIEGATHQFTNSGSINVSDDLLLIGGTHNLTNNGTLIINDNFLINTIANTITNSSSGVITINGSGSNGLTFNANDNIFINQGTVDIPTGRFRLVSSTQTGNSFVNQSGSTLTVGGDMQFNDGPFIFSNSGTVNLLGRFDDMAGAEEIHNLNGSIWNYEGVHNATLAAEIDLFTNYANNEFNYNKSTGAAQEVIVPQDAYWHLTLSGSGNKEVYDDLDINGNVTISSTANFDVNTNGCDLSVAGNWISTSTFDEGLQNVTFDGTSNQTLNVLGGEIFYNTTINKSSGNLIMEVDIDITNVFTLTTGGIDMNGNILRLNLQSPGAIVQTSGYVISEQVDNSSKLSRNIGTTTGNYLFPFGLADGTYIPLSLNLSSGDLGYATLSTYATPSNNLPWPTAPDAVTNLTSSTGAVLDNRDFTIDRFWQIDETGGSGMADITFSYSDAEVTLSVIGNESLLEAQRYNTTTNLWEGATAGQIQNPATNTVFVPSVTNFSPWTLALNISPLPITLSDFEVVPVYDEDFKPSVDVSWITKSEIESDYFEVQRSAKGVEFEAIGTIKAAGNSSVAINYNFQDPNPLMGKSYYRLKQVDMNGEIEFTDNKQIEISGITITSIYPNPSMGPIDLVIDVKKEETALLQVVDLKGKIVQSEQIELLAGMNLISKNLSGIASGTYSIRIVYNNGKSFTQKQVLVK